MNPVFLQTGPGGRGILVEQGRVVSMDAEPHPEADVLDATEAKVRPGLVCAHTHLYSGLAPLGMPAPQPEPESFVQILERVWWKLDRALDVPSLRASARLYVAEALLAGTTSLIDHHESPNLIAGSLDVLAYACAELGMRAVLSYGATERNGGLEESRWGLEECARFVREGETETLRGMVALHASFTVSDTTVKEAGELCRELDRPMHVHLAEDAADVADAKLRGYDGPLERLSRLGALPEGSILAHGVHLDAAQVERAAEAGLWLVQNPRSNAGNRVGYPAALAKSANVALGTDGYPARMAEEKAALMDAAEAAGEEEHRAAGERLHAGRRLIGERFGLDFTEVKEGSAADLVVWEARGEGPPRHVVVGGRIVVERGKLVGADLGEIHAEAESEAAGLWERMAAQSQPD